MIKTDQVKMDDFGEEEQADVRSRMDLGEGSVKSEYSRLNTPIESSSSSSSPRPTKRLRTKKESPPPLKPTLITDLPRADDAAKETYIDLERCLYESKVLGLSKQTEEMMVCDCVHEKGSCFVQVKLQVRDYGRVVYLDKLDLRSDETLCGPHDECINRLTQVECLAAECKAEEYCSNQRFAKRQYADIEVVQTEKKGFGLRARQNLSNDAFIYEYIGEVVTESTFMKRMSKYADEGIKHFYFMMLQKEEYIDATKKGGIGRFANHSCNPNCYVAKWVVGKRMRMGIFTKRDVLQGEELTFNYNVDRYGHDAQICYCGEPNCVGTIGGKTQTDIGGIDDIFLDALGIKDDVEALGLRGNRKKKSIKLEDDEMPEMRPIEKHESAKVISAARQSIESRPMAIRLMHRIRMTDDALVQQEMMRMHGFSMMHTVLIDFEGDNELLAEILRCLLGWKLSFKNKVEDSQIVSPVANLVDSEDATVSSLAKQLVEYWDTLPHSYRIPRRKKITNLDADDEAATSTIHELDSMAFAHRNQDSWEQIQTPTLQLAPVVYRQPAMRPKPPPPTTPAKPTFSSTPSSDRSRLDAIIALAAQTVQAAASVPTPEAGPSSSGTPRKERDEDDEDQREQARQKRAKRSAEQKDRKLMKMVGDVVVRSMSKYREQMEHDTFKRYAKECTNVLVEKEKKKPTYTSTDLEPFSDEKKAKLKSFTKEYTHKVLKKLKQKGKLLTPSGASRRLSTSTPTTPANAAAQSEDQLVSDIFGGDVEETSLSVAMTPEGTPPPYEVGCEKEKSVVLDVTPGTPLEIEMDA